MQEREREAALAAFHASIEARAAKAGAIAVAESTARAEREERLSRANEERARREAEEKVRGMRAARGVCVCVHVSVCVCACVCVCHWLRGRGDLLLAPSLRSCVAMGHGHSG